MARRPNPRFEINSLRQIEALTSPARQEIVDCIEAAGPSSASQLANLLGKPQDGLYYHIRTLVKTGLLVESETRATRRRDEVVYDLPGRPMLVRFEAKGPRHTQAIIRIVAAALRLAQRDFEAALKSDRNIERGAHRPLNGGRRKGWITKAELAEINGHIDAIEQILAHGKPRRGATLFQFARVLSPVEPVSRSRSTTETRP